LAKVATAAPVAPVAARTPSPATGTRLHDGFYLRIASGFGVVDERLSSIGGSQTEVEGRNRGVATVAEFALGGTLGKGWVLGGGIYSADLIASTYKTVADRGPPVALDPELRSLALIAPFCDYYPTPAEGLHFSLALGLATLTPRVFGDRATEQSRYLAVGGGLMLGTGFEWWVSDEWSLGVLARTTVAILTGTEEEQRWRHVVSTSPSLLLTLTYH
jgi:hypothetical protein